ncbi:hypothetical protein EHEL_091780 [Encephalitozoon hellem ATCC 50504]|uniref:Uncharacterized protein n=1 Tax=Encephalitozoon hellem TaxID=27973 RepID=A0A9Q9C8W4_ENCHE|nr:uncharacterized protein EHEL_091780 [Encephalitozoon hellem ATCC 50504]AFM99072.1 hypothetical protein EHEL_091780 [Encephalitozoon hellem ATCC 50504]UTX42478.1 hypothetical protein GPU96_01g01820 [Encephalitozoon hellem]WEL37924.1 hypothetical protein PFJ87_01g01780 [Encephalitozoon hellem]|eukprot:XP_003888053.1 hypothetical protein EHEL_091780 [Encephalitozoon hellem ATCC 50504]
MPVSTWPAPPKFKKKTPPQIPSSYTSFGTSYKVENGVPVNTSFPSVRFDKERFKELINLSFSTFIELLTFPLDHEELIEAISNAHLEINQILNGGKKMEAIYEIRRIRNDHTRNKNRIAEETRRKVRDFKI